MRLFPAFFQMDGAQIVIFGDGVNAERKVRLVAKTPARIALVTHTLPDWAKSVEQLAHVAPDVFTITGNTFQSLLRHLG